MSTAERPDDLVDKLKPVVMPLRIIVATLIAGVLSFAAVALFIRQNGNMQADPALDFMTWMALAAAVAALVVSWLLPMAIVKNARRAIAGGSYPAPAPNTPGSPFAALSELGDAGKLAVAYQTSTIVGAAVLEGAAFMNIVTYLVNGSLTSLVVGVCIVLPIAAMFPSAPRVANWIDGQLRLMADEKMLSR